MHIIRSIHTNFSLIAEIGACLGALGGSRLGGVTEGRRGSVLVAFLLERAPIPTGSLLPARSPPVSAAPCGGPASFCARLWTSWPLLFLASLSRSLYALRSLLHPLLGYFCAETLIAGCSGCVSRSSCPLLSPRMFLRFLPLAVSAALGSCFLSPLCLPHAVLFLSRVVLVEGLVRGWLTAVPARRPGWAVAGGRCAHRSCCCAAFSLRGPAASSALPLPTLVAVFSLGGVSFSVPAKATGRIDVCSL